MRKISVVCVGKLKEKYWQAAVAEYAKRISRFAELTIHEIDESKIVDTSPALVLQALDSEAQKIKSIVQNKIVIPLCIEGKQQDSVQFSKTITDLTDKGELCFVIGSSYGLSDKIKHLGTPLSFGKITLPHQLMRVVLLEQIYRAFTIQNNITYHK
ncbi:MAG: 23S rRNA (pseudouridine(1915)-N(3))-methyltransferase RlmH [Clostridia bacterium]|nr:23S rRNA (pseudouridine(1915)-N(3))-methyltransferase RlmH [Clostridia bacterium]